MFPLPTVLALRYSWIYIGTLYCSDIYSYIISGLLEALMIFGLEVRVTLLKICVD